jgi:hypothetical protein
MQCIQCRHRHWVCACSSLEAVPCTSMGFRYGPSCVWETRVSNHKPTSTPRSQNHNTHWRGWAPAISPISCAASATCCAAASTSPLSATSISAAPQEQPQVHSAQVSGAHPTTGVWLPSPQPPCFALLKVLITEPEQAAFKDGQRLIRGQA